MYIPNPWILDASICYLFLVIVYFFNHIGKTYPSSGKSSAFNLNKYATLCSVMFLLWCRQSSMKWLDKQIPSHQMNLLNSLNISHNASRLPSVLETFGQCPQCFNFCQLWVGQEVGLGGWCRSLPAEVVCCGSLFVTRHHSTCTKSVPALKNLKAQMEPSISELKSPKNSLLICCGWILKVGWMKFFRFISWQ